MVIGRASRWCVVLVASVVCSALVGSASAADSWLEFLGPNHDGTLESAQWQADKIGQQTKPTWQKDVGAGYSAVSVWDGKAYTMGNVDGKTDVVWCLNAKTGQEIWKHTYACNSPRSYPGPRATPAVDPKTGKVYTMSREGLLVCLDAKDGKVQWQTDLVSTYKLQTGRWGVSSSPVIHEDKLVIDLGSLLVLYKADGKLVYKAGESKAGYSTATIFTWNGETCVATFPAYGLQVRRLADGKLHGQFRWETRHDVNAARPIYHDGKIFISSDYGTGCALVDVASMKPVYVKRGEAMRNHFNTCTLKDGYLYGFDGSSFACVEWATGKEMWSDRRLGKGAHILVGDTIVGISERGDLVIAEANPKQFKPTAAAKISSKTCWTAPVLADGMIYIRNDKGQLDAIDVSKPSDK